MNIKQLGLLLLLCWLSGCSHLTSRTAATPQESLPLPQMLGQISAQDIGQFAGYYHPDALFSDPDVSLQGRSHIQDHFAALLTQIQVDNTRIISSIRQGSELVVLWESDIRFLAQPAQQVHYQLVSVLSLDPQGLIVRRQDYFDGLTPFRQHPAFSRRVDSLWLDYLQPTPQEQQ
ncbi:hypothetical protein Rhein_2525 [Rheinheimera sp. A13L]|uniref:nuclear transport factor 2 family protein n=1 Tax=Rheinheimera sp. A13L TaxID=506534 RepID=UPI00021254EB|nr:nuclear transport factor 2 family protein [Rheinheimera sp. A13L]EGM77244.1 hypothetical protein Rhein_2525 [Rheinheimera sp. A13L]